VQIGAGCRCSVLGMCCLYSGILYDAPHALLIRTVLTAAQSGTLFVLAAYVAIILQSQLMIVGIDVYHDSTFGQKKSVVGFIASTNRYVQFMLY
jgi:hypothetical protein